MKCMADSKENKHRDLGVKGLFMNLRVLANLI